MKKKMIMSAAAAAAIIFTGVGANQAEAANCDTVKQVTYKTTNKEDMQKVLNQYLAKYNITIPAAQAQQKPAQKPVQENQFKNQFNNQLNKKLEQRTNQNQQQNLQHQK